ncbi:GMC oxidoreductase [Micromonospora sp. NPDC049171]|uniref:GMC oxidoreductase n=1 Tax=Micromonospora sp. NPDC049171 TaxID=3155770 RepID=UPI00340A618C
MLSPRPRGHVRARALDPLAEPLIDHAYFSNPEGYDRQVALDGVDLAHKLAETLPVSEMATLTPWSPAQREAIADMPGGYWHPVGTCAKGPDSDPAAVAGADGRVQRAMPLGTARPDRIRACRDAATRAPDLTHDEWYELWLTARDGALP